MPWPVQETKDLIHEGIATESARRPFTTCETLETKDLIHEGIATSHPNGDIKAFVVETKDLIHEGIATIPRLPVFLSRLQCLKPKT